MISNKEYLDLMKKVKHVNIEKVLIVDGLPFKKGDCVGVDTAVIDFDEEPDGCSEFIKIIRYEGKIVEINSNSIIIKEHIYFKNVAICCNEIIGIRKIDYVLDMQN